MELKSHETYYRWKKHELDDGTQILVWFECMDYRHDGHEIFITTGDASNEWLVMFQSLYLEYGKYPGSTEMYLKDVNDYVVWSSCLHEIVKHAENYIRENKEGLERI